METSLLLINPVVHDFAAYDFWARPLGLLWVGAILRQGGARVSLLDCMDPLSPWLPDSLRPRRARGRGRFVRTHIPRPGALPDINRRYCQYGLPPEVLQRALAGTPRPDAVLVTSGMTYWYPGVAATVEQVKQRWPGVPLLLGGVYASLCPDHAVAHSGADRVLPGPVARHVDTLWDVLSLVGDPPDPFEVLPAHDLAPHADAGALLTSVGCPFRCAYCGVSALQPGFARLPVERVEQEVQAMAGQGIRDIAIYDDAFLAAPVRAAELLERVATLGLGLRLHAASGLACRGMTQRVARAMRRAGFKTIRLGLETADTAAQSALGGKVTTDEFRSTVENLESAGFDREEIGVYVLVGMPGQRRSEMEQTLEVVLDAGARPHLAEYSPVPGSPMFEEANALSQYDLDEPLYHNPTLLPCAGDDLGAAALLEIKQEISQNF